MISSEKAFFILLQTICVGGLFVGLISSNFEKIQSSRGTIPVVLGALGVTVISGVLSISLAERN